MARRDHGDRPREPAGRDEPQASEKLNRLLDVQEAARLLGLKPATLYQWAYKRRIPVVKLFGKRGALRFRLYDVLELINDSVRPADRPWPRR